MKFSVIMPVYNVEEYLRESLNSLLNQTLSDFEVICVNDGSKDNSLNILNEYSQKDNRIKVISQENQGQGVARNNAIKMAQGEYIVFVDPDDLIETNALEVIYNKFVKTNADIIHFDYKNFKDKSKITKIRRFKDKAKMKLNFKLKSESFYSWKNFDTKRFMSHIEIAVWNKAYSRDFLLKNNIVFAPNKHGEDFVFSINCLFSTDKIYYISYPLYKYRTRSNSISNKGSEENFCVFENLKLVKEVLEKKNLLKQLKREFEICEAEFLGSNFNCIPEKSISLYKERCKELLSEEDYLEFEKIISKRGKSFLEKLFSIKNYKVGGIKHKILTLCGCEFRIG